MSNGDIRKQYGISDDVYNMERDEIIAYMASKGWSRFGDMGFSNTGLEVKDIRHIPNAVFDYVASVSGGLKEITIASVDSPDWSWISMPVDEFVLGQKAVNKAIQIPRTANFKKASDMNYWATPSGELIKLNNITHEQYLVNEIAGQNIEDLDADEINEVVWEYMEQGWTRIYSGIYAQFGIETADDTNLPSYIDGIVAKLYNPNDEKPIEVGSYGSHISIIDPFPSLQKAVNKALQQKRIGMKAQLGSSYDFSSTQFNIPKELSEKIIRWAIETIPEEQIVHDEKDPGTKRYSIRFPHPL